MNTFKRMSLMLAVLLSCVGCDQVTKQLVRTRLPEAVSYSYLGDVLRLQHSQNHGAFLSLGAALSESLRFTVFTVAVAIALAAMLAWLVRKPNLGAFHIVAFSLVIGGGIGNLIDRLFLGGGVTDFLNVGIGVLRTGIFNIADIAIMAGLGMLLARSGLQSRHTNHSETP